jgi:hypothetical protein
MPGQQVRHAGLVAEDEAPAGCESIVEPAELGTHLREDVQQVGRNFSEIALWPHRYSRVRSAIQASGIVSTAGAKLAQNASSNRGPSVQRESAKGKPAPLFGRKIGEGTRRSSSRKIHCVSQ